MKCVMVINYKLPVGLIANTAAVLAVSIGHKINDIVGEDVKDKDGYIHSGITQVSIPLLKGDNELIHSIPSRFHGYVFGKHAGDSEKTSIQHV